MGRVVLTVKHPQSALKSRLERPAVRPQLAATSHERPVSRVLRRKPVMADVICRCCSRCCNSNVPVTTSAHGRYCRPKTWLKTSSTAPLACGVGYPSRRPPPAQLSREACCCCVCRRRRRAAPGSRLPAPPRRCSLSQPRRPASFRSETGR